MKKYIYAILSAVTLLLATGCESYLNRPQLDKVGDDKTFWRDESDFRMYSMEFYTWFFSGYNSGYGLNYTPLRGYTFNDDLSTSAAQENFLSSVPSSLATSVAPDLLLNQSWYRQYNGERWNFGWVRKANIMLARVEQYKANLSDEAYRHWSAVARFFRAYAYFNLVVSFGDVPYFDKPIDETDVAYMYKDRDPRNFVTEKMYDDLKYAMENAYTQDNASSQYVHKYLIASLASRFMLFEGTWQKYHSGNASLSKKYLELAVEASQVVMESGKYSCDNNFRSLFGSMSLAGHPEIIFYRHYETGKVSHSVASYSNGIELQEAAANLQLLKAFVCVDGHPYTTSTVANANDFTLSEMAKTRDPRFEATFYTFPLSKSSTMVYADKFISRTGASYYANQGNLPTQWGSSLNVNDAPVVRYAEVLLNWIEAKAELNEGGVTQNDIDLSINAIRNRPLDAEATANGVTKTASMQLASLPDDPDRDSDVSALLWEIRRERRMEFLFEHTRLLDIKRWKKISYMDNNRYPDTMFGSWVDFPNDLPNYLSSAYINKLTVRKADGTEVVYNGSNGSDMVGFYKIENVVARNSFDESKMYVSPVGLQEIQDYVDRGMKLTQTADW